MNFIGKNGTRSGQSKFEDPDALNTSALVWQDWKERLPLWVALFWRRSDA
jgi:hypothetical protein